MNTSELFFPAGWLALTSEQSAHVKSVLGKDVTVIPVYNVVPLGANNAYMPLTAVPGLACLVVHELAHAAAHAQGEQTRALPGDEQESHENRPFSSDSRVPVRPGDDEAAKNAKLKPK
ncbi:hypothetical protein [Massilia antarctica]|uniref:hypothetical protein n=1 Tax=Massilia antarctica TaxID=2765360 RepID=UPI0006BB57E3|nr:hypothetical protein [Massilia sp. H27-R4]MCY0913373.1 hypothetical protein [Massilia sp. H27-R4]CUI09504.1 hypothetical protein BN2497_13785 [Janthinobacterium sp. CG23_2]CUU33290.1 hypothetical protein BN3177_13785 [Janthinobacterium sp. CG23_2]